MMRLALFPMIALLAMPATAAEPQQRRLPPEFHWGRCTLAVDGKTYLNGRCAYQLTGGGSFVVHGPKQVFPGVDFPKDRPYAEQVSRDYFAIVNVDAQGAEASWNEDIRATHAQSMLGKVARKGGCWVNRRTRICLWK
jgi:hypothetical protein